MYIIPGNSKKYYVPKKEIWIAYKPIPVFYYNNINFQWIHWCVTVSLMPRLNEAKDTKDYTER